jgi:hypothetical protein
MTLCRPDVVSFFLFKIWPMACHFFWLYVGHWKTTLWRPDDVSFFIWLYVGHQADLGRFVNVSLWSIFIKENLPKLVQFSFFFVKKNWLKINKKHLSGPTFCHFLSDFESVVEKQLYVSPTMCHFLSDFVSVIQKWFHVGPTLFPFFWIYVGLTN